MTHTKNINHSHKKVITPPYCFPRSQRRGLSPDIFTWILGLVAGALILIFFIRFAGQHISVSDTLRARELLEHIDDQLRALTIAESSSTPIAFPDNVDIRFQCGTIETGDAATKTTHLVFAPARLTGGTINAWTEMWSYPFDIAPFTYLSNDNTRHLLVYDDRSAPYVTTLDIPRIFNLQRIHATTLDITRVQRETSTADQIIIAFFAPIPDPARILSITRPRTTLLSINTDAKTVTNHNDRTTTIYLGDEMLIGALFAPDQFICLKEHALERLAILSRLYADKAQLLQHKTANPDCLATLASATQTLTTYADLADDQQRMTTQQTINHYNALLAHHDCPTLY